MAESFHNNGFNDEDALVLFAKLDSSDFDDKFKNIDKKINSLKDDISIDIDPEAISVLEEMQKELKKLKTELTNVKDNKVSRGVFEKFKKEIKKQVDDIEERLDSLGDALVKVTEEFGKVGTDFDISKVTEGFKEATDAIKGALTAVDELNQTSKNGLSFIVDDPELHNIEVALKGLKTVQKEYQKLKNSENFIGLKEDELTLEKLVPKFKLATSEYKNWSNELKRAREIYDSLNEDPNTSSTNLHIAEINRRRASLQVTIAATKLSAIMDELKEAQKSAGVEFINFDSEKNIVAMRTYADIAQQLTSKGKDAKAVISAINEEISKYNDSVEIGKQIPLIEKTTEVLDPLIKKYELVEKNAKQLNAEHQKAREKIEEESKAIQAQKTLRDLIDNRVLDIKVEADTKQLEQELNAKIDALQEELWQKSIFVPIRVYVDSTNIADAGKEVGDISPEVSSNKIEGARKEIAKTGEEATSVIMDLDKVTDKSLKSILKVVENAVNKFVNDTKNAINSIFVESFKVKVELDKESKEGVKQDLTSDIVISEAVLSQNIKGANEAAKVLVDTMKEILSLVEETGVASGTMIAGYTKTGRKRSENKIIEDLVGKLSQYREGGRKIQAEIQDIFTKHPILLDLALKDGATDKILKAVDESNFGFSLQRSLTHAQSIAESIVEILKPLNGLEIKVEGSKGTASDLGNLRQDLGLIFNKLNQILESLIKLEKFISGGELKKSDDQLKQISLDFTEITEKIDTLIGVATEQIANLTQEVSKINTFIETLDKNLDKAFDEKKVHAITDEVSKINTSIETLGENIDKTFDEKKIHVVTDEIKKIDLSSVNVNLAEIFKILSNIFSYIQSINGAIKVTDSFKLGDKWSQVERAFRNIATASGNINFKKNKKEVEELLALYQEYIALGGKNDLSLLTTNQKTLAKLQNQADKFIGGRNIVDTDILRETKDVLRQIDEVLSSLTTSLSAINGLDNVSNVFKALNIKQENIDKIRALPGQLKQISDELRELDNIPYSGFVAQLSQIIKQAEGLKALAEILRSSPAQIQNAIDKTNGGKENEKALKEQLKIVSQLENQYKKLWNSGITEQSQPEIFADSLRAIEIILKDIHSIGEQKAINDSDIVTVKQLIDDLKEWLVVTEQIKHSTTELDKEFDKETKTFKKFSDIYTKLFDDGDGEVGKSQNFLTYLHSMADVINKINELSLQPFQTQENVNYIKQANQQLEIYATKLNQIITEEKELEKNNAKDLGAKIRDALKITQSYERHYSRSWGFGKIEENYTSDYSARLLEIRNTLNEINSIKNKGISTLTEADLELINNGNKALEEQFKELVKINQVSKGTTISNLQNKMSQYILKNSRLSEGMVSKLVEYIKELDNVDDITKVRLNEIAEGFNRVQYSAKLAGREGTGFLDAIRNKLKYGWAQSIAMFFSFYDIVRYIREISSAVIELNTNLIELSKVSDVSIGELYNQFKDFADIAKETGATINDVISATADWSRNGFNLSESKDLAKVTEIYKAIGDGITNDQANEYLVSTLKGFNLEADEALSIIDKLNNVSNNAAISMGGLGEGLERSSSALNAANTDLSESIAIITTASEIIQSPDTVGTGLKSMSARLRGASTELEEMGEEATLTTSKLRALVKALTGVDIQKDENTYKSVYQILLEIGKVFNDLTDVEQASLSEALFG